MSALKRSATCCMRRTSPCGVKETTSADCARAAFAISNSAAAKIDNLKFFNKNMMLWKFSNR